MPLSALADTTLVRWVGLLVVSRYVFSALYSLFDLIRTRILPWDYKNFGEWAVVTGASDGIGQELSRELARNGMKLVLISRSEDKLLRVAKEIENDFNVETKVVQADFTDRNCYKNIEDSISDLDVGVLVNNVGMATLIPKNYTRFTKEELWNELNVNCGAAMIMTNILLHKMRKNRRGLIVNNASLSAEVGLPHVGIYSATKSFIVMFSYNIQEEVRKYNVTVRCLVPGVVVTKMVASVRNFIDEAKEKFGIMEILCPDVKTYAKWAINSLASKSLVITGYWGHTMVRGLLHLLSMEFRVWFSGFSLINANTPSKQD